MTAPLLTSLVLSRQCKWSSISHQAQSDVNFNAVEEVVDTSVSSPTTALRVSYLR